MIVTSHRRWFAVVALAVGLTVMLHGCHGPDEDHELFAPFIFLAR